jgi:NAD(P)-dependent dehydrogenase (short-subunit alcohol dehydrogenase family)
VSERHPRIQLLVNNAGIPGRRGFAEIDLDRLEEVLRVNYLGAVWCLRAFLPALEAADARTWSTSSRSPGRSPMDRPARTPRRSTLSSRSRGRRRRSCAAWNPRAHRQSRLRRDEGFRRQPLCAARLLRKLVVDPERVARTWSR